MCPLATVGTHTTGRFGGISEFYIFLAILQGCHNPIHCREWTKIVIGCRVIVWVWIGSDGLGLDRERWSGFGSGAMVWVWIGSDGVGLDRE